MRLNHPVAFVLALGLFFGCSRRTGRDVATPRVVSLVPSVTETIFALGAQDHLLAVTRYCDYPKEAMDLPTVGDLLAPSYERILGLRPDRVYVTLPLQRKVSDDLTKLGIECTPISPESFGEILESIRGIAHDLGVEERGETLVCALEDSLDLELSVRIDPPVRVYIELSSRPLYTVGGRSFIDEVLEAAGARNIFQDVEQAYFVTSTEEVLERAPEAIVLLYESREDLGNRLGWSTVPAVQKGRIIAGLDPDLVSRPGPRFVEAIRAMRTALERSMGRSD